LWCYVVIHTNLTFILQRFHAEGATAVEVDGFKMVQSMAANVEIMMQHKIDAIKVSSTTIYLDYFWESIQMNLMQPHKRNIVYPV